MKKSLPYICLVFIASAFSGCGTPGFPRQSYDENNQIKQLEMKLEEPDMIPNYFTLTTEETKRAARDKIISGRLALIDLNYNQFIARFSVKKQSLDAGTEIVELGVNLATTAVGGEGAKTIFGAISSGITGSKLAIDKNFFFEKTIPVLITSMNAQRKVVLEPILKGMKENTEIYPLPQALSDLGSYYFAGTFIGALQAIQADAGSKEVEANKTLNALRETKYKADDAGNLLQSYWMPETSGTVVTTKDSNVVVGSGTHFNSELAVGYLINIGGEMLHVETISDDSHLTTKENVNNGSSGVRYLAINTVHQKEIEDWLNIRGMPNVPIQTLITGDSFSEIRKQVVTYLKIKPSK